MGCCGKKVGVITVEYRLEKEATKVEVSCPYCGSTDTECFSLFGQQLLTVQYYCNTCHTPFERIKDDDVLDSYSTRKESQS